MRRLAATLIYMVSWLLLDAQDKNLNYFFSSLSRLEFEGARQSALNESDMGLRSEMLQLTEILFCEGQVDRGCCWEEGENTIHESERTVLVRALRQGYFALFFDHIKGDAYRHFYSAYELANEIDDPALIKPCLIALLRYYNLEIAQNSDSYVQYLNQYENLQNDFTEEIWLTIYRMIFLSKELEKVKKTDGEYFQLAGKLEGYEKTMSPNSPLLPFMLYETGLKFEILENATSAKHYYTKTIELSKDYPYLRYYRFFASLKLMMLEISENNLHAAQRHLDRARLESDCADILRSDYHLDLYGAFLLRAKCDFDESFNLLWQAYQEDFKLDFRRNTLEVGRFNVELQTQEKENANLRLRGTRVWLISALTGTALLLILSYLAYVNQRTKTKVQIKEKEMQGMKLEKLLKAQEILGIDAMIEGQEKERQRIANDLHDNLGSLLTAIKFHFQNIEIEKGGSAAEQASLIQKTKGLFEEVYEKVRKIAHAQNVGVTAREGLLTAIRNFASKVSDINRLTIDVEEHGMDKRLENSMEITIFRIIQELITNVIRHAQATEVVVHLTQHENSINLMVEDNGIGFDPSQIKPHDGMGLYSIQKRIENLGGQVTVDTIKSKGTTVIIDVPLYD